MATDHADLGPGDAGTPRQETGSTVQIGAVAQLTGLSIRTLRHYDEVGLVRPSVRSMGGFRLYTGDDVARLLLIRRMKPLGFTLDEMADLLEVSARHRQEPTAQTAKALDEVLDAARERRQRLVVQLAAADEFIDQLDQLQALTAPAATGG